MGTAPESGVTRMKLLIYYYSSILSALAVLTALCVPAAKRYFSRVKSWELLLLPLLLASVAVIVAPYISIYGDPEGMNWKHELGAAIINKGLPFAFNHRLGYVFLLDIASLFHAGGAASAHASAMALNFALFLGCCVLFFTICQLLFDDVFASVFATALFAFHPDVMYECLSCEHRIASAFFVLLTFAGLIAFKRRNRLVFAAIFFLAAIYSVEARLDNLHYFCSYIAFIFIFRKNFPRYFFGLCASALAVCAIIVYPFAGRQPGFFSFLNLDRNLPEYMLAVLGNPICVALFFMGVTYEIKRNANNAAFILFALAETLGFWLMAGTVSVSREYLYIHIPLCLMAARAVPGLASMAQDNGWRFKAALAGAGILFFGYMFLHPPPVLVMFKANQGMDREIRTYLKDMPRDYSIIVRPEYTAIISPETNNLLPAGKKLSFDELGDKILAAKPAGVKRIVCFSPVKSKYDCGLLELWTKRKNSGDKVDYAKDTINNFNFESFYSSRSGEKRAVKKYLRFTELIL